MPVIILNEAQKTYIVGKYQANEKSVIQLAGQFGVSSRTIKRVLAEAGVLTIRPTRDERERYLLAMCKKYGITHALQLKELKEQAEKTQRELFAEPVNKFTNKDLISFIENADSNTARNIAIIAITRMSQEISKSNKKLEEQINYGKQYPTQAAYQISISVSYSK